MEINIFSSAHLKYLIPFFKKSDNFQNKTNTPLASTFVLFQLIIYPWFLNAAQNEPFPMGYSMLNFGTIIQESRISGRQPWIPESFAKDTISLSLSSVYTNFYSAMDNLKDKDFHQIVLGFWINLTKVGIKGSAIFFNALGIYKENKGFLSIGTSIIPFMKFSMEVEFYSIGLTRDKNESEKFITGGLSFWIPMKFVSLSMSGKNVYFSELLQPGFKQPSSFSIGLHTISHRFGSQGILLTYKPKTDRKINMYIGEELFIHPKIALNFAFSTRPPMVSFGILFTIRDNGFYSSFVHHPVLGWSQGIGMEYVKKR